MHSVIAVNKPIGKTPLEVINGIKNHFPEYEHAAITYAGRLDPLAHGVLILLVDEAIKEKDQFLQMEKAYTFEVLFGIQTDTYDFLGIMNKEEYIHPASNVNELVNTFVSNHIGVFTQPFPPFSSKTVQGKPLFQWAKENRLDEIVIPEKEVTLESFSLDAINETEKDEIEERIIKHISLIKGDFRQKEILKQWNNFFNNLKEEKLLTASFSVRCSSGTYVRGLAHKMGQELGCGAIAIDICRTQVGQYTLENTMELTD